MLRHLRITNFAILSDVEIDFGRGFNVLTGETGAGKSLIVDAVALLRGGRARSDIPRAGAEEAVVEAVFDPPGDLRPLVAARLEAAGLAAPGNGDDGELVVRRVISRGGRSRIHVNGGLTTAAALARIGDVVVDLAGQHEHQGLVDGARHLEILDAFGVDPKLVARAAEAHEKLRELGAALGGGEDQARQRAEREDFLRFQIEEIDGARLAAGEESELAVEKERLRSAGRLGAAARRGEEAIYSGEGAIVDRLAGVLRELDPLVALDGRLVDPRRQIGEAHALLEDAAIALRRYGDGIHDDPDRLAEVEDRLHLLSRLMRKHGATSAEILAKRDAMAAELAELEGRETRVEELRRALDAARAEAEAVARKLTDARRAAGARLERAAGEALAELGMAGARITVSIQPRGEVGPRGWDRVELLLGANRGEEPRPLAKIASGGELSRIMLALKLCLRHADPVGTYVFDEVDAGVGGGTAEVVGRQIRRVADTRQVICVTHLAQIAALADSHFRVEKTEVDGRTETLVKKLGAAERREEVARMLGGLKITSRTRAHADEMLRQSR
jgi:DNA repair protein RecN (Recombination protein N)